MKSSLKNLLVALVLAASFTTAAHAQIFITENGQIQEIDPATNSVENTISADNGFSATALTIDNGTLYVATEAPDQSSIVVASYNESLQEINSDVATFTPLVSGDGSIASVNAMAVSGTNIILSNSTYNNGELEKIDLSTTPPGTTEPLVSIGDQNDSFDGIVAYNGVIYATRFQASDIELYNVSDGSDAITPTAVALAQNGYATGPVLTYMPNFDAGNSIAISPDGQTLYVMDIEADTIITVNAATGALINGDFIAAPGADPTPYWGNLYVDGNNLYVEDGDTGALLDYDATTGAYIGTVAASGTYASSVAIDNSAYVGDPISGGYGVGTPGEGGFGGTLGTGGSTPGSAPEPRSWALAALVALGFFGIYRQRRQQGASTDCLAA